MNLCYSYREYLLADSVTVSVHVDGFNEDVADVFSSLDDGIQVLVVSAAYSQAFASICHDLFVLDHSQDLNHLLKEVGLLKGRQDSLVLPQTASQTPNQIFYKQLRFLLD